MRALYKIVHTAARTQWQDPEKRILDESLWMQEQGHQVVIIAPPESPLLARAKAVGLSTYALPFRGLTLAAQAQQLKGILENEQPNILNAHGRTDGRISLKAAKKAGVPCRIISCHSAKPLRSSLKNKYLYKRLSHYVFTDSAHATMRLKTTFSLKDMEIFSIPGGIILPRSLGARQEAQKDMADRLGLGKDTLFIGLLEPCQTRISASYANQILKVLEHIPSKPHLLIPGAAGEIQNLLQHAINRSGLAERVHLVAKKNRWDYYRALSCGIHIPSRRYGGESIPRSVTEAMHAACPIVARETQGISEVISNGKTGLLWNDSDPKGAADAIGQTLTRTQESKKRADAARELISERYTIDVMARDIIRIYTLHQVRLDRRYHKVDPDLY